MQKRQPIFETNSNKSCRYRIKDDFFAFWFRFIFKHADLICEDGQHNRLDLFEVKRDPSRIDLNALEKKAEALLRKNPELNSRKITFGGLSLEDL